MAKQAPLSPDVVNEPPGVGAAPSKAPRRRDNGGNGFSASPIAADGKIYLTGESGNIHVIEATTEFKLLATNPIGEPLMATPAISEGVIYVRGAEHLFAIGEKKQP